MAIDFSPDRWEVLKENYRLWWEGKRFIASVELSGRDVGRPMPKAPLLAQANCHDFSVSAEDVIDRVDYELSGNVYLGDAFPFFSLNAFGPSAGALLLGAKADNSTGNMWCSPPNDTPITELHFEFDPNNIWLNRIKDICHAAVKRWKGQVLVGNCSISGAFDTLAVFRTTEELLIDLYDYPEEVERLVWEIHHLHFRIFDEINSVLFPVNPGYSDWLRPYSDTPYLTLQSDFAFMIGPDMFDRFVKPELEACVNRLGRSMYHLDGVGQLAHLDSLLQIEKLDAVQWMPGAGAKPQAEWPEVYQKVIAAGKSVHGGGLDTAIKLIDQIGNSGRFMAATEKEELSEEAHYRRKLAELGL